MEKRTVLRMLQNASEEFTDHPYVLRKFDDGWKSYTFAEVRDLAEKFAAGLISLGFEEESSFSILAEGLPEWVIGELGIVCARCVSVPLSIKLQQEEVPFRINHSESAAILFTENTLAKVFGAAEHFTGDPAFLCLDMDRESLIASLEAMKLAGTLDNIPDKLHTFDEIITSGENADKETKDELNQRMDRIDESDTVTICYTSGTTGNPKGIMLTHLNYWANCYDSVEHFQIPFDFQTLVILPVDHSFAHTVAIYTGLIKALKLYFVDARKGSTLRNIPVNLLETNPDMLLTVPALSGNFMKKIISGVEKKGAFISWLFHTGVNAGIRRSGNGYNKPNIFVRFFSWFPHKLADALVFSKVRQIFGNRIKFCVGGGALLDVKQQEFFNAIGVPIYQGYGLTEAAPVISSNVPGQVKFGTSGRVLKSITCKLCDDKGNEVPRGEKGEIVIQGDNVMKGYFRNEEATAKTIKDGWLYTGDLAYWDKDDFLVVVGREKALLISEDGEKYSPEEIEEAIVNSSGGLIQQAMIYNDHRKYTTALLVLDEDKAKKLGKSKKDNRDFIKAVQDAMNAYNRDPSFKDRFPPMWRPSAFAILPEPFTEANKMINSTMKMVRFKITETYTDTLEYLYSKEGRDILNDVNKKQASRYTGSGE